MSSGSPAGLRVLRARSVCPAGSGCGGAPCPGEPPSWSGLVPSLGGGAVRTRPVFAEVSARAGPGPRGGGKTFSLTSPGVTGSPASRSAARDLRGLKASGRLSASLWGDSCLKAEPRQGDVNGQVSSGPLWGQPRCWPPGSRSRLSTTRRTWLCHTGRTAPAWGASAPAQSHCVTPWPPWLPSEEVSGRRRRARGSRAWSVLRPGRLAPDRNGGGSSPRRGGPPEGSGDPRAPTEPRRTPPHAHRPPGCSGRRAPRLLCCGV